MKAESETQRMRDSADDQFGFRILVPNPAHERGACRVYRFALESSTVFPVQDDVCSARQHQCFERIAL